MAPKDAPRSPSAQTVERRSRRSKLVESFKYLVISVLLSLLLSSFWISFRIQSPSLAVDLPKNPADEWEDNVFPFRNQTPWDISTNYPYPRVLDYDVQEGTWLRLDVHPTTGDIVFDMIGDLYCILGNEALSGEVATARPILVGVPHDSDPRFSPNGDRIVFRSDAELGVENIWALPWKGCREMDLRGSRIDTRLGSALKMKEVEEGLLIRGVKETAERKTNRLIREGRWEAQRVTNETFRYVTAARFHPSGTKVIASKWFTSTITIGASEGWEFDLSSSGPDVGRRVLGRTVPPGGDYGEVQIGPEQFLWWKNDTIIYSKNTAFDYKLSDSVADVHKGTYAIFTHNVTTQRDELLVSASPGGASRPEISRDGRTLAFVRRERDHEILVLKDLVTGTLHYVWDGLSYDTFGLANTYGTYPSFAFSPSDDAIIIWAAGQIYSVALSVNDLGEKVANPSSKPRPIRFTAHIEKRLAETLKTSIDVVGFETKDTQRVNAFKELVADERGERVVFQAAGVTIFQDLVQNITRKVPVLHPEAAYYSPSFAAGDHMLVIHARWSDTDFTSFEVADLMNDVVYAVTGIPMGRYFSPTLSRDAYENRRLAFLKSAGDSMTGFIVATASPGLYITDAYMDYRSGMIYVTDIEFIPSEIDVGNSATSIRFLDRSNILVQQSSKSFVISVDGPRDIYGRPPHTTLTSGRMSNAVVASPISKIGEAIYTIDKVAFLEFQHVYLADGKDVKEGEELWAKPGNSTKGLARLSLHGGHDIVWSGDGRRVFWLMGPVIHSLEMSELNRCSSEIAEDHLTFGISCVDKLVERQEVLIEHSTDIARLKEDAVHVFGHNEVADVLAIYNATLLTMHAGNVDIDCILDGVMIVKGGVIQEIGVVGNIDIPTGASIIDVQGGYVIPGFIDAHAHWGGYTSRYPAKSWEMQVFLAYGVTTMHNPSSHTVNTHVERSLIESGYFVGPRIFTTGTVLFSGGWVGLHEEIVDNDQAYDALLRIKAEAGQAAISYKNYQLPSRASRQRALLAARNLSMLCVPEGGANNDWDLTYIIDGMTTLEHSLSVPVLYDDIITLFANSGSGYTPTHVVSYAGASGEQLVWATEDIPSDPKLRRFIRHDILERLTESVARPPNSYGITNTSISAAKMVDKGLKVLIGAHGEPPMGHNYHAEMAFTSWGGLSNYQVLQAATSSAAITLGIDSSVGSLAPGKLADFLIYPPETELLDGPISGTRELLRVARGGRVWDASTMEQVWPLPKKAQTMPPLNPDY